MYGRLPSLLVTVGLPSMQEVTGLDTLTLLEELYLGKNKIAAISGLTALRQLRVLSVQVASALHCPVHELTRCATEQSVG